MEEFTCRNCHKEVLPHAIQVGDRTDFVEVKATHSIETAYKDGYPSSGHMAVTFAGCYCSLRCAAAVLASSERGAGE